MSQSPSGSIDLFHNEVDYSTFRVLEVSQSPSGSIDLFHLRSRRLHGLRNRLSQSPSGSIDLFHHLLRPDPDHSFKNVAIPLRVHRPFCTTGNRWSPTASIWLSQSPSGAIDLFHIQHLFKPPIQQSALPQSPSGAIDLFHIQHLFKPPIQQSALPQSPSGANDYFAISQSDLSGSSSGNQCRNPPRVPSTFFTMKKWNVLTGPTLSQAPSGAIDLFHHLLRPDPDHSFKNVAIPLRVHQPFSTTAASSGTGSAEASQSPSGAIDLFHGIS